MKKRALPLICFLLLIIQGCKVTVPSNDKTPPTTVIKLMKDNQVKHTYKTGGKPLVLSLNAGDVYDIIVEGNDKGGVSKVQSLITGIGFTGDKETIAPVSNARDRRILTQTLDPLKNGDLVTISTRVEDFKSNRDTLKIPQVVISVGRVVSEVKLTASSTRIREGQTATLKWTSQNVKGLKFSTPTNMPSVGSANGNTSVSPKKTTTYTLQGTSQVPGRGTHSSKVLITVIPEPKCLIKRIGKNRVELRKGNNLIKPYGQNTNTPNSTTFAAGKAEMTKDSTAAYVQLLTRDTGGRENLYLKLLDLKNCRECRSISYPLIDGSNLVRGSMGILSLSKTNYLLAQLVITTNNAQTYPNGSRHAFDLIDLNNCRKVRTYNILDNSIIYTPKGKSGKATAFFFNKAHTKVGVLYATKLKPQSGQGQNSMHNFYVAVVDLKTGVRNNKYVGQMPADNVASVDDSKPDEMVFKVKNSRWPAKKVSLK